MNKLISIGLIVLIYFGAPAYSMDTENVWDVLRGQFRLNHEVNRPEVQEQIRWLIAHPSYLHKVSRQCEPYIYHVVREIIQRKLPGELALLPMLESAFDPFAYSVVGAAGLWQLMPKTGNDFGLKQDWWYDDRRSIGPSTTAALNYLVRLNKFFKGDWTLAIAAYDSGEGTVLKAIKSSLAGGKSFYFWGLPVPQETKIYVPRLLALAELVNHPEQYHVRLPFIPFVPYFAEVTIGSQIDLDHAAKMAGISYKELIQLNPGFNRWTTSPNKPFRLLIPKEKVNRFYWNLANLPTEKRSSWQKYRAKPGERLEHIAQRFHTTVHLLKEVNHLASNQIERHQDIFLPTSANTEKPTPKPTIPPLVRPLMVARNHRVIHIVQHNDTYRKIAEHYGVSISDIQRWNNIGLHHSIYPGETLTIWKKMGKAKSYTVRAGDTLNLIAKNHQTNIGHILALNPQVRGQTPLRIGQKILIS